MIVVILACIMCYWAVLSSGLSISCFLVFSVLYYSNYKNVDECLSDLLIYCIKKLSAILNAAGVYFNNASFFNNNKS